MSIWIIWVYQNSPFEVKLYSFQLWNSNLNNSDIVWDLIATQEVHVEYLHLLIRPIENIYYSTPHTEGNLTTYTSLNQDYNNYHLSRVKSFCFLGQRCHSREVALNTTLSSKAAGIIKGINVFHRSNQEKWWEEINKCAPLSLYI